MLAEFETLDEVLAAAERLRRRQIEGVDDVVVAARTILIRLSEDHVQVDALLDAMGQPAGDSHVGGGPISVTDDLAGVVEIVVHYDGGDLAQVAQSIGLGTADVVALHTSPTYTVAFCGFAPGFAYLVGGPGALQLPRRATPRTRVPVGSVAIAGPFTGIYPTPSPGGWHLLGHTDAVLFDTDRHPPALLPPGTRVRFAVG